MQTARSDMMLNMPVTRLLIKMSVPTIISMLITSFYNMADAYFVHYLGTAATGAVGVNFAIEQIIMTTGSFLATGANSYIARLLGAQNTEKASCILSTAFFTSMLLGAVISIFGLIFIDPLVVLLGATESAKPFAVDYGGYILYAAPFMAANFVLNQCLRSEGSAAYSMFGMLAGGILNIFLDPLFIFVFNMGISGAAIATSLSKIVSFVILILPYLRRKSMLQLSIRNVRFFLSDVLEVASIGSASLFRTALGVISGIIINNIAGNNSDACLAAISVTTKIMMVPFAIFLGFGQGFQPTCGFNWGAGRYDRVRKLLKTATIMSLTASTLIGLAVGFLAAPIIREFSVNDPEMIAIGEICLRSQCLAMPVHAWGVVINMLYAGLGKAKGALLLGTSRQGTCFLPMVFLLCLAPPVWLAYRPPQISSACC